MADPFIAEIRMFAGTYAPRGWAFCNGQILAIAQNSALFALIGTTYGGNGQTTFALPDLRGRVPVHAGQGPGLSPYSLGEQAGSETVTLLTAQMPMHTHQLNGSTAPGAAQSPNGAVLAAGLDSQGGNNTDYVATAPNTTMSPQAIGAAGGSQPHENRQPFLSVNFIIALEGIFPSRN
jgi:microcystin-dependent protein